MPDLSPPWLPAGYQSRPATTADVRAIHRLVTACELELDGRAETDLDTIAADLGRPGLAPELDTLLVYDPVGELVARAWVNRRSEVDVHPGHRGRGLGSSLLAWVEARARQVGTERLVQTASDGDRRAGALLRSRGYQALAAAWLLEIAMPAEPAVPEPPRASPCGGSCPATSERRTSSPRTRSTSGSSVESPTRSGPGSPSSAPRSDRRSHRWPSPVTSWSAWCCRWTPRIPTRGTSSGSRSDAITATGDRPRAAPARLP